MKKLFTAALFSASMLSFAQNFEISTLRMGDFKIFSDKQMIDGFAKRNLPHDGDKDGYNTVKYNGEIINVYFSENFYENHTPSAKYVVFGLKTKSKAFKTKAGLGVGSSREELITAYKNFSNFSVYTYKDESKPQIKYSIFSLKDSDAGTSINFNMENNVVVEVHVSIEEGC